MCNICSVQIPQGHKRGRFLVIAVVIVVVILIALVIVVLVVVVVAVPVAVAVVVVVVVELYSYCIYTTICVTLQNLHEPIYAEVKFIPAFYAAQLEGDP